MEPEPQSQEEGIPPEVAVQQAQEQQWRETRYGRWQQEQHSEPSLGLALLWLALASVMHARLADTVHRSGPCSRTRKFRFPAPRTGHQSRGVVVLELETLRAQGGDRGGRLGLV